MPAVMDVHGVSVPILGIALLGVVVGYVAGMFGIGGGFLMTPLLVVVFRIPLPVAVGSGLCQMVGTSLVSFMRHPRARQGEPRFDMLMLPGSIFGVVLGARTLTALASAGSLSLGGHSVAWISVIVEGAYTAMLVFVAWNYWTHGKGSVDVLRYVRPGPLTRVRFGPAIDLPAVDLRQLSALVIANIGLALGFLSGLLGIGGGVALNPVLIYGFGFPIRQAVGTGIIVLFVTSMVGTFSHALKDHVDLRLAVILLVGGTVSAQFGARASRHLSGRMLGRIHAVVILAAVVAVLWDLVAAIH
jgi:uncharacterized membrane protein YfcA